MTTEPWPEDYPNPLVDGGQPIAMRVLLRVRDLGERSALMRFKLCRPWEGPRLEATPYFHPFLSDPLGYLVPEAGGFWHDRGRDFLIEHGRWR